MGNNILFQSQNLNVRQFTVDDAPFIFELLNTPTWKQFIGDRNINTLHDALNYIIDAPQSSYNKYGYGLWLVILKESDQPIGMCGLVKRDYLDQPDLGFAYLPEFAGRGLAYEAANATIKFVKENYLLPKIYAVTTNTNLRSQRLLGRCGFVSDGLVTIPNNEALLLYTLYLQ